MDQASKGDKVGNVIAVMEKISPDWNEVLRVANQGYDRLIKAAAESEYAQQIKALHDVDVAQLEAFKQTTDPETIRSVVQNKDIKVRSQWVGNMLMSMFMPSLTRAQILMDRAAVQRDAARIALALAAYKADKGEYPENLDALSPAYLKVVPLDLYSGKAFIYKPSTKGYILYSVGENMIDDGGKSFNDGGDEVVVKVGE